MVLLQKFPDRRECPNSLFVCEVPVLATGNRNQLVGHTRLGEIIV